MENPLNSVFSKASQDLRSGIESAMLHLKQGMQEYLADTIDLRKLLKMVEGMGIPNIAGMVGTSIPGLDYYKVLGLEKTASNNEIKQRYREIMNKLHPDKAGQEMAFLAALVNVAYQTICKEREI